MVGNDSAAYEPPLISKGSPSVKRRRAPGLVQQFDLAQATILEPQEPLEFVPALLIDPLVDLDVITWLAKLKPCLFKHGVTASLQHFEWRQSTPNQTIFALQVGKRRLTQQKTENQRKDSHDQHDSAQRLN
jgi:hypothetical protein